MKVPTLRIERSYASDTSVPTPQRCPGSIKHFDGSQKTLSRWDGLRRDPMLWFEDGDCLVHLYAIGGSQRGPSFRLRYSDIKALNSKYLLNCCLHRESDINRPIINKIHELYLPAPAGLTKAQAYEYHITTRNFFAYAVSSPVVGVTLGAALAHLVERIKEWQLEVDAAEHLTRYYRKMGYADMAENADYALASLTLAERAKLKPLWTESFVHCVGMHDRLFLSPEYGTLSDTTKALVTRASLEMNMHIARVLKTLGTFLEDELGAENLGLSKPARDHLDRFRSCLHNYYVEKLGYYPLSEGGPFNKRLWTKMYHAFHSLYKYLVDSESSTDLTNSRNLSGGICVAQNVQAFDERHGYSPLPHPVPLLPMLPARKRSASVKRGLRELKLARPDTLADPSTRQALAHASNSDSKVMASELVQEYQRFERLNLGEKLSISEARKVRWLLIYGVLQMLISITRAPGEVKDTETPTYPLCVLTADCPAWPEKVASLKRDPSTANLLGLPTLPSSPEQGRSSRISIHPDCEAGCAEDYFNSQSPSSRRHSQLDLTVMAPAPLRIKAQQSRATSFRYSVHSGMSALQRSFSRRNSVQKLPDSRRPSLADSLCETMAESCDRDFTDDEEKAREELSYQPETEAVDHGSISNELSAFDFGLDNVNEEPVLESHQLEQMYEPAFTPTSTADISRNPSDASTNATSRSHVESDRSSTLMFEIESATTDPSSADDDDDDDDKRHSGFRPMSFASMQTDGSADSTRYNHRQRQYRYSARWSGTSSISAGCYVPTGFHGADSRMSMPVSKFARNRRPESEQFLESPGGRAYTLREDVYEEAARGRGRIRWE